MTAARSFINPDPMDVLPHICHAFASTTDPDEAVAATVGWASRVFDGVPSTVSLALPDVTGRLRLAATVGRKVPEGRLRSLRRRRAFDTKRSVRLKLPEPEDRVIHIVPLVSRGTAVGVLEVVAPSDRIDERLVVLDAVVGQAAAVLRNSWERRERDGALSGLGASVGLAAKLLRARSRERAVRIAVELCNRHLQAPVIGWLPTGDPDGVVFIQRGLGPSRSREARRAVACLESLAPSEAASDLARAVAPVLGATPVVVRAGGAMLTTPGVVGEAGTLLLETVGRLLEEALMAIGAVTEARARSDGMDLGIAWTAHELRGPLVGARASIDRLIARDGQGSSSDLLRDTREELERLASLVDPLLRWTAGSGQLNARRTDLVKIVGDAIASCELVEDRSRIALLAPKALEIRADPKQLRTAVANLVRNAITYSPEGAGVTVEVGRTGDEAWVCVRDRGPGVPRDEQELIFDPFARGAVGAGSRRGTGLGLFIARRVVEAHGGNVRVLSNRRGAAFCIELPLSEGGRARSAS